MIADRVKELSTSTGTGAIALSGAVAAYQSFSTAFGIGPSFDYCIEVVDDATGMPTGSWEIGRGHLSGATTLVRDTVQQSSNADALVAFGAGTKNVFCTLPASAIDAKVDDTGDTMTGPLNLFNATTQPWIGIGKIASNDASIWGYNGSPALDANARWGISLGDVIAETGSDSGSNFTLRRCNDAGGVLGTPIAINRATGNVTIDTITGTTSSTTGALTVAGGVGVAGAMIVGGSIGVGITPVSGSKLHTAGTDITPSVLFAGVTKGLRFGFSSTGASVESVDNTGVGSFQPLTIGGTTTTLAASSGVIVGAPTGGAKGVGTINAVSVFDDNVLLTCFGTQYAARGAVNLAQWDAVSPTGNNKLAHKFVDMLKGFDPRNPKQYIKRMLEDEALPGMPTVDEWRHGESSLGEMHNRLWLATELLASAFVGLHNDYERRLAALMQRVETLEKRT